MYPQGKNILDYFKISTCTNEYVTGIKNTDLSAILVHVHICSYLAKNNLVPILCPFLITLFNSSMFYFRLKMIEILSNFFRSVTVLTPDDLRFCVYLCLNQLAPAYEGIELGLGDTVLMKAIAQATGMSKL